MAAWGGTATRTCSRRPGRAGKQLAYARTLLSVVMEAATQMEEVVSNFVQIEHEQATAKEEDSVQVASAAPTECCSD